MGHTWSNLTQQEQAAEAKKTEFEVWKAPELPLQTQTRFQGERGPFSVKIGQISPDILEYLCQNTFLLEDDQSLLSCGFYEVMKNPEGTDLPKRKNWRAVFHALSTTNGSVTALNVRTGLSHEELSAPIPLKSFVLAFLKKNGDLFEALTQAFPEHTVFHRLFKVSYENLSKFKMTRNGHFEPFYLVIWHFSRLFGLFLLGTTMFE